MSEGSRIALMVRLALANSAELPAQTISPPAQARLQFVGRWIIWNLREEEPHTVFGSNNRMRGPGTRATVHSK
jgi:hypothetical protein